MILLLISFGERGVYQVPALSHSQPKCEYNWTNMSDWQLFQPEYRCIDSPNEQSKPLLQSTHSYCIYTSGHILLRWFCRRPSITMLREHSSQACIRRIYASPPVLSSTSEPALVRVANCRVFKCVVCSGSSMISPRMFIIMRPTLCGEVRQKIQLRNRIGVPQWKLCTALGWKVISAHIRKIYVHGMFTYFVTTIAILISPVFPSISIIRHAKK